MTFITADRIKETTTVTGTGPITLLGAVSGYRPFSSVMLSIGDTCPYAIVNADASQWEVGIATYTDVNTLTRTTIHASTADPDTDPVDFAAGVKDVFLAPTASTVLSDLTSNDGTVTLTKVGSIVDLSVAIAAATENVIVQVRNNTGEMLTKGTVVYINDALGQLPTVAKALATSDATSAQTLGMISADLGDNDNGYVTIIGLIDDISLDTGIYNDGDQLYLSGTTAGEFTKVKPYAPTHLVYVGIVEHAHNVHGKIFVKVQNGYELDELHDVSAQNPTNGQTIVYNSTTDLWEKNTVSLTAGVNGVLPVANGGTGVTTSTGSGNNVLSNAPTLTTATFAAGTISASTPNTITQTWNNAAVTFTGLNINVTDVASNASSLLTDLQVGGVSQFQVDKSGAMAVAHNGGIKKLLGLTTGTGSASTGIYAYGSSGTSFAYHAAGTFCWGGGTGGIVVNTNQDGALLWATTANDGNPTLRLHRDANDTLAQRRSTNPQTFRVYNTYTDASNWERLNISWSSNICTIGLEKGGTGTNRTMRIDMGGNPNTGGNYIEALYTNYMTFVTGGVNTFWLSNGGSAGFFRYYYAGQTIPIYFGQNSGGNTNRVSDKWVLRAYGGTGNTAPTYIGFGAAYSGVSGSAAHTQEDCFLVRLLASATPIVAFGSDFLSTVPAIKRTGTRLISRLADDSGYATWEGPLNSNTVNAIALPLAATVTAATGNGTTVTYTCSSTFAIGQVVSVTGLTITTGSSLNLSNQTITGVTATTFTVANTTVGTAAATQAGTATIQSAGNSVTITAGNGSGVGAGGNIILQPGAQGTSGGNGSVVIPSGTSLKLNTTEYLLASSGFLGTYIGSTSVFGCSRYSGFSQATVAGALSFVAHGSNLSGNNYITTNVIEYSQLGVLQVFAGRFNSYNTGASFAFPSYTQTVGTSLTITNKSLTGNVATLTTSTPHKLSYGQSITISGVDATFDGTYAVTFPYVMSSTLTTFSYAKTAADVTSQAATGAATLVLNNMMLQPSAFVRLNVTTEQTVTGIAPPIGYNTPTQVHVDGRMIRIYNVGGANLTLSHNSAASTTTNRFWNATGADIVLSTHQYVELIYDSTDNGRGGAGWRVSSVH